MMSFFNTENAQAGLRCIVIGGGSIGTALATALRKKTAVQHVSLISRKAPTNSAGHQLQDYNSEEFAKLALKFRSTPADIILIATGTLHSDAYAPEKSLQEIQQNCMEEIYRINTIVPSLAIQAFAPFMRRDAPYIIAALSARVGSISDNHIGGWYSYRASKAALNMMIRCASIELKRKNPESRVIALHPGTVNSALSQPFQRGVQPARLFSPAYSAEKLLDVINHCTAEQSGTFLAWDGTTIPS